MLGTNEELEATELSSLQASFRSHFLSDLAVQFKSCVLQGQTRKLEGARSSQGSDQSRRGKARHANPES